MAALISISWGDYKLKRFHCEKCGILALAITVLFSTAEFANGKGEAEAARAGAALAKVIGRHINVQLHSFGETKHYVGFPPKEIVLQGSKRFDELNLYVDVPGKPWICYAPMKEGSKRILILKHDKPEIEISLIVNRLKSNSSLTTQSLLKSSQSVMRKSPKGKILPGVWEVEAASMNGLYYEAEATPKKRSRVHFSRWLIVNGGYSYHLTVSGPKQSKSAVEEAMSDFLSRIRPIEHVNVSRPNVAALKQKQAKPNTKADNEVVVASDEQRSSRKTQTKRGRFRR